MMASILRVAIALNAAHSAKIQSLKCKILPDQIEIVTEGVSDLTLEEMELKQAGAMFENVFGKPIILTSSAV